MRERRPRDRPLGSLDATGRPFTKANSGGQAMTSQPQRTRGRVERLELRVVLSAYGYDSTFGNNGIAEAPHVEDVQSGAAVLLAPLGDGDVLLANQSDTF